jgi:hypothetical protein
MILSENRFPLFGIMLQRDRHNGTSARECRSTEGLRSRCGRAATVNIRHGLLYDCRLANAVPLENNFELRDVGGATRRRGNYNVNDKSGGTDENHSATVDRCLLGDRDCPRANETS